MFVWEADALSALNLDEVVGKIIEGRSGVVEPVSFSAGAVLGCATVPPH